MYALKVNEEYSPAALGIIQGAKEEILLSTFKIQESTRPDSRALQVLIEALQAAALGGRRVKFLLNWERSRRGVARTNESVANHLASAGVEIRYLPDGRCNHAKILIVDGRSMIAGSHNWSRASLTRNFELSIFSDDEIVVAAVREVFFTTWHLATPWRK